MRLSSGGTLADPLSDARFRNRLAVHCSEEFTFERKGARWRRK